MASYARAYDIRARGGVARAARRLSHEPHRKGLSLREKSYFFGVSVTLSDPALESRGLYRADSARRKPDMATLDRVREVVKGLARVGISQADSIEFVLPGRFARPSALEAVVLGVVEAVRAEKRKAEIDVDKVPRRRYPGRGPLMIRVLEHPFPRAGAPAVIVVNRSLVPIDIPLRSALLMPNPAYFPKRKSGAAAD